MSFWRKSTDVQELPNGITVSNEPEDVPEFKRVYSKQLDARAKVTVTAKSFMGRMMSGELTQPNGRWVLFEPRAVADKILDPALVPLIEAFVSEVERLDHAYMANDPGEFVDEKGTKWQRV